jgi:iron complex transport system substrate-binding protein
MTARRFPSRLVASRRSVLLGAAGALGLAACGGRGQVASPPAPSGSVPSQSGAPTAAAFPRTVAHSFGETAIPAPPTRVASLGYTDHDALMALGVLPVLVTQWFPAYAIGPWAQPARAALGGADPQVIQQTGGIPYETVAAARPDLLTAVYSGMEQPEYDRVAAIGPTVARVPGTAPWQSTWDSQVTLIGGAVGKPDDAARLVEQARTQIDGIAAQYPQFRGRTVTMGLVAPDGTFTGAWTPIDPRVDLALSLGFTYSPTIAALEGADTEFYVEISEERFDLLEADVVVVVLQGPQSEQLLRAKPTWQTVPAVQQDRVVYLPVDPYGYAMSFGTVLSVPFAVGELARRMAEALSGLAS